MNLAHLIFFAFWPGAAGTTLVMGPVCVVDGAIMCPGVVDGNVECSGLVDAVTVCPGAVDKAVECDC